MGPAKLNMYPNYPIYEYHDYIIIIDKILIYPNYSLFLLQIYNNITKQYSFIDANNISLCII